MDRRALFGLIAGGALAPMVPATQAAPYTAIVWDHQTQAQRFYRIDETIALAIWAAYEALAKTVTSDDDALALDNWQADCFRAHGELCR